MVFNATFNNISVKSWQSVLLVEETRVGSYKPNYHTIMTTTTPVLLSINIRSFTWPL